MKYLNIFFEKIILMICWLLVLFFSKYIIKFFIFFFTVNLIIIFIQIIYGKLTKQSMSISYPGVLKHESLNIEWINLIFWRPFQLAFLAVYIFKKRLDGEKIKVDYKIALWIIFILITGMGKLITYVSLAFIKAFLSIKKNSFIVFKEEIFLLFFCNDDILSKMRILIVNGIFLLNPNYIKQLIEKYSTEKLKCALNLIKENNNSNKIVTIKGQTQNGILKSHPAFINEENLGISFTHYSRDDFFNTNLETSKPIYAVFVKNIDGKITDGSKFIHYSKPYCNWMLNNASIHYLNTGLFPTYYTYLNKPSKLLLHDRNNVATKHVFWSMQQYELKKKLTNIGIDKSDFYPLFMHSNLLNELLTRK